MIDAALLRAFESDETTRSGARSGARSGPAADRREACAFALAALKAGEALMDRERFARTMARLDRRGSGRTLG
ncbi:MAG: hypothetical protein AAGI51_13750 [Pseudomonadota bacterium]